jgi:putative nucleotidyltransferase with HDIG domain
MEKINLAQAFGRIEGYWSPKIAGRINDTYVKLARLKGEFTWHHHADEDELFFVVKGRLLIKLRDRDLWLDEGEFAVVPRGVEHLPVATDEVHVMLVEPATTVNTGMARTDRTVGDQWLGGAPAPPAASGAKRPGRSLGGALLTALQSLPDGARQLVHLLDLEEMELEVEEHLAQVGRWSVRLAAAAGASTERQRLLAQAALLHDVGKLGLSRALLRKPGRLDTAERAALVQHVGKGVALLRALDVEDPVVDIVAAHHERWDGSGYPRGLAGEAILPEARMLAIADSFDAMTSERVYHRARTRDEATAELRREAGRQFDGRLVGLFIELLDRPDA